MKIHQLTVEEALASLHTQASGLDSTEAERRLLEYGPNRIREERRRPLLLDLLLAGVAVAIGALLLIAYTPLGNGFFGTAPVAWTDWLWVLPFAMALIALEEARKWRLRRATSRRPVDG